MFGNNREFSWTEFFEEFALGEALRDGFKGIMSSGVDHAKEHLKANVFGIGVNDEVLFLAACVYAQGELKVPQVDIERVCAVIDSYPPSIRKRIVMIIGKDEQPKTSEVQVENEDGSLKFAKGGKPVMKKSTETKNFRGAEMIKMLAGMTEAQMKATLKAAGALNTLSSRVKHVVHDIKETAEELWQNPKVQEAAQWLGVTYDGFKNDYESFLTRKTALSKIAEKIDVFGIRKMFS